MNKTGKNDTNKINLDLQSKFTHFPLQACYFFLQKWLKFYGNDESIPLKIHKSLTLCKRGEEGKTV